MMIIIGSVASLRNLPATALFGTSLIFLFAVSAVFFLIPCALVSAELGASFTERGGVYIWIKEAFGDQMGLLAVWLQWSENVIWYPTLLSFIAASLAYVFTPSLAQHRGFLIVIILITFWGASLINSFGIKTSAIFASICSSFGLLIPLSLIILLGIIWIINGHVLQIHLTLHNIIPHLNDMDLWRSLTAVMVSFCGVELATVHASDVKNPQRNYPRALFYAVVIMLTSLLFGSLALAFIIPVKQISLVAGVMQAFELFFSAYHLTWLLPLLGIMLVIGGLGQLNNWIIAPTRGLLMAAEDGNLPKAMEKKNRHHMPARLLFYQAILVSILSSTFLLIPSINGAFWLLTALTAELYMLMYALMFAAGIWLRYKSPNRERPYKIPGKKNSGMWFVSILGLIAAVVTISVSFVPISIVHVGSLWRYELIMLIALLLMIAPPFVLYSYVKYKNNE